MESKVLLYDANDVKVGETFMRRARQLVKQQRASWIDDSKSAVRFAPDVNEWETVAADKHKDIALSKSEKHDDSWMIAVARRRISERNRIIVHTLAFVPGWLFIGLIVHFIDLSGIILGHDMLFALFVAASSSWVTAYVMHVCQFVISRRRDFPSLNRMTQLETEIALLRSEFQRDK